MNTPSTFQDLLYQLDRAPHEPRAGESIIARLGVPAWESDDPTVQAVWRAMTDPRHIGEIRAILARDLNAVARELLERALAIASQRQHDTERAASD